MLQGNQATGMALGSLGLTVPWSSGLQGTGWPRRSWPHTCPAGGSVRAEASALEPQWRQQRQGFMTEGPCSTQTGTPVRLENQECPRTGASAQPDSQCD